MGGYLLQGEMFLGRRRWENAYGYGVKEVDILLGEFKKNVTIKGYFEFIQF